jgi:Zn-dependent M16 (insulinase) family peptidase
MNTELRQGQVLDSGFTILEITDLAELKAPGIWARHDKTGAEVFHIYNDDPENLFAFAFATIPEDSSGAAHILEHSVLCGSDHYPLKDAFLVLAQGSLQTFLNAWTFPDKTLYPASSVNEQDYFNIMSVYGDAVFRPLLSEWAFMQEGHRLVYTPAEKLSITGVVYNEMKGSYSSLDAYAEFWSIKSVLPGTPYEFESGGDPECIPDLNWEGLKAFHRSRYSPANCKVFLAGNIPTEKQLSFLNEQFFSQIGAGRPAPAIKKAERWTSPRSFNVPCPAGGDTKATVFLSWLCSDSTDSEETMALGVLMEVLLGHDGSPLIKTLLESGLGEDIAPSTGMETELRETVFTAGLRGVSGAAKAVEDLIMGELRRIVGEGLPKEEIDAALLSIEFSNREIKRAGGPYSLVWLRRSFRGWLYGTKPWDCLLFVSAFARLKERLAADSRYLEALIQKYFLDNPHRALVVVEPTPGFLEKKEERLEASLTRKEASLKAEERQVIREKSAGLERIQGAPEDPAALAAIPHLSRKDLPVEIEAVPRELHDAAGIPVLTHNLFTNGITYIDIAFPVDTLSAKDYYWLPLFSRTIVSLGLPGMDYAAVSSLLARTVGGVYAMLRTGSVSPGTCRSVPLPGGILDIAGRDWIVYHLKTLDEKLKPSLELILRLITEADFSDQRRLRDLVLEMKNESDSSLAPGGHSYAGLRAGRGFSHSHMADEIWSGLEQLNFVHTLTEGNQSPGYDISEVGNILTGFRDKLRASGCIVNIIASSESMPAALSLVSAELGKFGLPRPRNPASLDLAASRPALGGGTKLPPVEVFASPSLQVGFAAMTIPGASFTTRNHAAELVLSHQLSTGALWEDIRMKGGAYGAFAYPDGLEEVFTCSTYRDPEPLRSLEAFPRILRNRAGAVPDEEGLEKAIIGTYAKEVRPRTATEKGTADFSRFLYGINDFHREQKLRFLVDMRDRELGEAAGRLAEKAEGIYSAKIGQAVIIAGSEAAKKAAAALKTEVQELPV